jgi:hypothetical protein
MTKMSGLLGRIGQGLQSPAGTGALVAGAFGVNPLLGLLAGPAIKNNREKRALELETMREGLLARQQQREAVQALPGAMRPDPLMEGIEQYLPAQDAQRNAMDRQAKVMGLLGQISPAALAEGVAGQVFPSQGREGRTPNDLAIMQALGLPMTPEGFAQLKEMQGGNDQRGMLDLLIADLQRQDLQGRLNDRERARLEEAEKKRDERRQAEVSVRSTLRNANELNELNRFLQGTAQETGLPWSDVSRTFLGGLGAIQSAFGYDPRKAQSLSSAYDRFTQLSTNFGLEMIEKLRGTGAISQQKFDTLMGNTVNPKNTPEANALALADIIDAGIDGADAMGFSIEEREQFVELSKSLRQMSPLAQPSEAETEAKVIGVRRK